MYKPLPIPDHFDPRNVETVFEPKFEELATSALQWAVDHKIQPFGLDRLKTGLMLIDVQNTFCIPDFELFVGGRSGRGAIEDNVRLCEFIYRNLGRITRIFATMDTHRSYQVFHAKWLLDRAGKHPGPYTLVSVDDVLDGKWRLNPAAAQTVPDASPEWMQALLLEYCQQLAAGRKYDLTIWPYHAMLGSVGHALVASVMEAIFFHSHARSVEYEPEVKGGDPVTESYSVIGPEVLHAMGQPIAERNHRFVKQLREHDRLIIAGQAKSHCVAWTVDDLLVDFKDEPELLKKIYILEDCTTPVVAGTLDYTDDANRAFDRFAAAGMHIVRSTSALDTWPDF